MSTLTLVSERPGAEHASAQQQVNRFLRPFKRYGRLFLTAAAVLAVLGVLAILILPRTYTAEVRLIAGNPNRDVQISGDDTNAPQQETSLPILNALLIATGLQSTQTYAELIQETPVAQRVVDSLHLPITAEGLLTHVRVAPINDTPLLSLKASWSDPGTAADIANGMAQAFVERERELVAQQADAGISFITSQLPYAEQQVRQTNAALARFMAAHHLTDPPTQSTLAATALDTLDQKIAQTQVDRSQSQAQLTAVQSEIASTPTMIPGQSISAPNPDVLQLQQQLSDAQVQLADDLQRFTDRAQIVIQQRRRIADLQQRIAALPATITQSNMAQSNEVAVQLRQQAALLSSQVQADTAAVAAMKQELKSMLPSMQQLPGAAATLAILQRQAKLAQDAYYAMVQKYDELTVAKSTALSDLTVTQPATAQGAVATPSLKLGLIAVAILALGIAFALVLFLDIFDSRVADERDIEQLTDLPVLGRIDDISLPAENTDESQQRLRIEAAYDEVLDAVRFAVPSGPRTIAVLSPSPGDGKTTIAIDLAVTFAERQGSVLIVDGALRKPAISKLMNVAKVPGLGDVLLNHTPLGDAIQHTAHPRIDVLASGTPVPNPIASLQPVRLRQLFSSLANSYGLVVIDTCALNPVYDSLEIARSVDASILVLAAGQTRISQVTRAFDRLGRAEIRSLVGYVLNRAKTNNERLAYYSQDAL